MFSITSLSLLSVCLATAMAKPQAVTCGSVVKLMNNAHKVRLHSHDVKYGSGSGQQSVTGTMVKEDVNSHWTIKGPEDKAYCKRGEPIVCGEKIRLEHLTTHRNLHSHHFSSPLTSSQEVSAFGDGGNGDSGDVWAVMCEGDYWVRDDAMMLKHVDTGAFLGASGQTFGRPINGQVQHCGNNYYLLMLLLQMEIVGSSRADGSTKWRTQEGVYIHSTDFDPKRKYGSHDEL